LPAARYMSLYAKIVTGLAVSGPFDYLLPDDSAPRVKEGCRVWVDFAGSKLVGYVVGTARKTRIHKVKPILTVIDQTPVLSSGILKLTRGLADYYCCYWGEMIETALPRDLRKGKRSDAKTVAGTAKNHITPKVTLLHERRRDERWQVYFQKIKACLAAGRSVIFLSHDIPSCYQAAERFRSSLAEEPAILFRDMPKEMQEWQRIKDGKVRLMVGTRAGVFAPLADIGLMIIDHEEDTVYKQDQVPHYHARKAAMMRAEIESFDLLLGSTAPSLESMRLARSGKIDYLMLERRDDYPDIKVVRESSRSSNQSAGGIISQFATDLMAAALQRREKVLIFLNRRGFATQAACHNCGKIIKCPRCSINLVYHFKERKLVCCYCNFCMDSAEICPQCNSGYIKYSGIGTEKVESEISRVLPQARINRAQDDVPFDGADTDIYVATQQVMKQPQVSFDLSCVLSIDNILNRADLRAAEKSYALLCGLCGITRRQMLIQSQLSGHHVFRALQDNAPEIFYREELKQRKQLGFPPFGSLALIKLRGLKEDAVALAANKLFDFLKSKSRGRGIEVLSVNPAEPAKLRGKFWWQITLRASSAVKISKSLKISLKEFKHSGIIVTVDVDPV